MKLLSTILGVTLFIGLLSESAFSEQPTVGTGDTAVYIFESIIVYGEREPIKSALVKLEKSDIMARNASTVADVFRSSLGMVISSGPKSETETKIRGFPASDVLVLVDGRPINPGYYGKVDLSMLPLDNVAKIVVVKGPADAAYGANSMGGVINIITQNGTEIPHTEVSGEFGDYQYRKLSINHSRRLERLNYWISAYENYSRGFRLSNDFAPTSLEDGGLRNNSSFHKLGIDGKIGSQLSSQLLASLSLGCHVAEKDIASTIYTWDGPTYRKFPGWSRYNATLSSCWQPRARVELKGSVYVDAYHDRLVSYLSGARLSNQLEYDSRLENWTTGFTCDVRVEPAGNHTLRGGLSVNRYLMNKQPDLDEAWYSRSTFTGSMFLQWDWQVGSRTDMSLGMGYQLFVPKQAGSAASYFCPQLTLRQTLPMRLNSHLSYGRALRFPTIHELYSESSGNEGLRPEYADKYELGIGRWFLAQQGKTYLNPELTIFYNELSQLIYRESSSYQYRNIGSANLYGWEISANCGLSERFKAEIGYGRLQSSKSASEMLSQTPKGTLHFLTSISTRFGLEVNYRYSHYDRRSTYFPEVALSAYGVHDLNLSQRLTRSLKLRIEASNLTDTNYQEELGYPAPGRQYTMSVLWKI
jgi:outer membrane cobalamin receptor